MLLVGHLLNQVLGALVRNFSKWPLFLTWLSREICLRSCSRHILIHLGGSAVVWYVTWLDSHNRALWVRFNVWYWYQSFIDGSKIIWGVDRTDHWGSEIDHPPLGRSYLVVVPSFDVPFDVILLTGPYGWDLKSDIDINPLSMGPIFEVWIGQTPGVPKWTIRYWAVAI